MLIMNRFKFLLIALLVSNLVAFSQEPEEDEKSNVVPDYSEDYDLLNLSVNSFDSDFGVTYFGKDRILFSSTRKDSENSSKKWKGNNQRFLNFYLGELNKDGDVISYETLAGKGNTRFHESNATYNKERTKVYFTRNSFYQDKKILSKSRIMKLSIYIADVDEKGKWINIVPFPYNSEEYSNGHPTLSLDGKIMYFTSDMPGTMGKTDIFKVDIKETGTFTLPVNLGGNVNTPGREMFPFIAADGTLYFSSDYHEGMGRLDIFKTDSDELELAAIQNIGEPFNTRRDDFAFILNNNLREGFFSSNRPEGKGDDDIYYFESNKILEVIEEIVEPDVVCENIITGMVTDAADGEVLPGSLVEIMDVKGNILYKVKVDEDGSYSYDATCSTKYFIKGSKSLYIDKEFLLETSSAVGQEIIADIALTSEVVKRDGKIIIDIESIYFDYDSHKITPRAATELDKVIAFMDKYPKVIIEGGSHTDARGSNEYNMKLSQRRAKSTVGYISFNGGYDQTRISARGYGETQLVNRCKDGVQCLESEHAWNRRTEFVLENPEVLEE